MLEYVAVYLFILWQALLQSVLVVPALALLGGLAAFAVSSLMGLFAHRMER